MRLVYTAVLAAALAAGWQAAGSLAEAQATGVRAAYTVEPFTPSEPITIQGTGVRLRAEPFATKDTPVLSSGSTGLQLTVVGIARQSDWNWYQVILRNGQKAFIRSDLTSAPSRGGGSTDYADLQLAPPQPVVRQPVAPQPVAPQPVAPRAVRIEPINPIQTDLPPPIPSQPQSSGVISLTPGAGGQLDLPSPSANPAPAPADTGLLSVSPSAPAPSFGDAAGVAPADTMAQYIRAQLDSKRCWSDSSSMMDAQRLRASFMVSFGPNGRFSAEPRLIQPAAEPSDDPAMMVFIAKARAAMRTCNALGFDVPPSYFSSGQGGVRLDFSAR